MADTSGSSERLSELRARWEADRRSRIFLQLAEEYRRQGQPLEAMAVLDEGLSRHPSSVAGKVLQGRCRLESGQAEAAAATLEEVVQRDPTHLVAYRWLTEAYLQLGDASRARERLEVYTQLNPQGEELPDLSRRVVALESPARKLSGSGGLDFSPPPRPSAEVTEAPTTVLPLSSFRAGDRPPPSSSDPDAAETDDSDAGTETEPPAQSPASESSASQSSASQSFESEAPTTAVPIPGAHAPRRDHDDRAGDDPVAERRSGGLWPWQREVEQREVEQRGVEQRGGEGDRASEDLTQETPIPTEAPTAKLRLESLGLVPSRSEPEETPASDERESLQRSVPREHRDEVSAPADSAAPAEGPPPFAADAGEPRDDEPSSDERTSEPPAAPPPSEQPTAEIPWWRPRPARSPFDTQETVRVPSPAASPEGHDEAASTAAGATPTPQAGVGDSESATPSDRDAAADASSSGDEELASEAPTGIFRAPAVLGVDHPLPASEGDLPKAAATDTGEPVDDRDDDREPTPTALEPPSLGSEPPPLGAGDRAATVSVFSDLEPASSAGRASRPERRASPSESEPFADLLGAPDGDGEQDPRERAHPEQDPLAPAPATEDSPPAAGSHGAGGADDAREEIEIAPRDAAPPPGAERREAPAPAAAHAPDASGNGASSQVFRLDRGALLDSIDLSAVPTRPLSIPFWLEPAGSTGRPPGGSSVTPSATPTLAQLYLEQGHAREAEEMYGSLLSGHGPQLSGGVSGDAVDAADAVPPEAPPPPPARPPVDVEVTAVSLLGDFEPERGGLTAKQVYVLQRYLARLRGRREEGEGTDVS